MSARRTRRSGGAGRSGGSKCAWCKHMGTTVDACTWKARGQQSKFVVGAGVAGACFGHMVAAVWDGSAVRQQNKDRLKRCLALSVAEHGNGAGAPPQHAWAAYRLLTPTLPCLPHPQHTQMFTQAGSRPYEGVQHVVLAGSSSAARGPYVERPMNRFTRALGRSSTRRLAPPGGHSSFSLQ